MGLQEEREELWKRIWDREGDFVAALHAWWLQLGEHYDPENHPGIGYELASAAWGYFKALGDEHTIHLEQVLQNQKGLFQELSILRQQVAALQQAMTEVPLVVNVSAPQHHGYVYIVQADNGLFKIGKARKPKERVQQLGIKLPYELDVVLLLESGDYSKLEATLHQRFASKRVAGEWFALDEKDLQVIKEMGNAASEN